VILRGGRAAERLEGSRNWRDLKRRNESLRRIGISLHDPVRTRSRGGPSFCSWDRSFGGRPERVGARLKGLSLQAEGPIESFQDGRTGFRKYARRGRIVRIPSLLGSRRSGGGSVNHRRRRLSNAYPINKGPTAKKLSTPQAIP